MAIVTTRKFESRFATPMARKHWLGLAAALWLAAVVSGLLLLQDYKQIPGASGAAAATWPVVASIPAPANRPTLLVFSHPRCPCTRATFRELERILCDARFRIDLRVVFAGSELTSAKPEEIPLYAAAQLPLAEIYVDNGQLAKQFGVETSGQVLLYNADGELQFSGGVTSARGHEGDSIGGAALTDWLCKGNIETRTAPVFGCPLFTSLSSLDENCPSGQCRSAPAGDSR